MNIADIIATIIAAILGTLGGGTAADIDDTAAPFAGATPVVEQVTPNPPCAGEGCDDRAIESNGPAYVEETADRTNPYHLPDECADGTVECVCTPDHGCRAVGPPPIPNTTGPDWTGYEYLLDPGPDTIPLTDADGPCAPLPADSTYPGATAWTFQPCDPAAGVIILNPCRPIDPATTWECVTAYTGERRSLEPQDA